MTSKVYWDSNCFLGWFNGEPDKVKQCQYSIEQAENGELLIVTSALTIAEVIRIKGQPRLSKEKEDVIASFFEHEYIVIHNVDRRIAETARHLMWKYTSVKPKDAIHIATSYFQNIAELNTFDNGMLELDGQIILKDRSRKLRICHPHLPSQTSLFDGD